MSDIVYSSRGFTGVDFEELTSGTCNVDKAEIIDWGDINMILSRQDIRNITITCTGTIYIVKGYQYLIMVGSIGGEVGASEVEVKQGAISRAWGLQSCTGFTIRSGDPSPLEFTL